MSLVIGLTGPTGAGKSSVTSVAVAMGFKVINCDELSKTATQKNSDGLSALVKVFGKNILLPDGNLNRAALANAAFSSKSNTELLNRTILPYIVKLIKLEINAPYVLLDAPTLFESGVDALCNSTIAVLCDAELRKTRIMKRDGIDGQAADLRIGAGKSDEFYLKKAQNIVYNSGDLSEFKTNIKKILNKITEEYRNV